MEFDVNIIYFVKERRLQWLVDFIIEHNRWADCCWQFSVDEVAHLGVLTAFVRDSIVFEDVVVFTDFPGTLVTFNIISGRLCLGRCCVSGLEL